LGKHTVAFSVKARFYTTPGDSIDEARRAHEAPSQDHSAVQRWKRALGRFIETYGRTANEEGATEQGELHLLVIQTTW
jgi:hypothetical protein